MIGRKHTKETKKTISLANIGRKHTKETKNKMSKIHSKMVNAFNIITKELKAISKEEFDSNPNWKGPNCKELKIYKQSYK